MKVKTLVKPLSILSDNYKLDEQIKDNELLLVCADDFNDEACDRHLAAAEAKVLLLTDEKKLKKRIFYIIVESLQNISRHKADSQIIIDGSVPMMIIGKHNRRPYILTANPIENEKIDLLKEKIDIINATGLGDLRQLYKETLKEGSYNNAGGANLGLIDIARKAGGQLQYGFERINTELSYFILKINIEENV